MIIGLIGIVGLLILVFLLSYRARCKGQEEYIKAREGAAEGFAEDNLQAASLSDSNEYRQFYEFQKKFCESWDKVIDQSMKVDQSSLTKDEYISNMENTYKTRFARCPSVFTANPEPLAVLSNLPSSEIPYRDSLDFMMNKIGDIKQQTSDALSGKVVSVEGFECKESECAQKPCVCTPESPRVTRAKEEAIGTIIDRLKKLNPKLADLEGRLVIVKSGLNDLEAIKKRAESGEIIKDINIPQ